jgi:hypothetical protein
VKTRSGGIDGIRPLRVLSPLIDGVAVLVDATLMSPLRCSTISGAA